MTWLHRPTSCHDTALSIGTDGHCQFLPEAEPGNAKKKPSQSEGRAVVVWAGGGGHDTGRREVDGQTESVMEAHSSNERKSVERGEREASTGRGTASRALTP